MLRSRHENGKKGKVDLIEANLANDDDEKR